MAVVHPSIQDSLTKRPIFSLAFAASFLTLHSRSRYIAIAHTAMAGIIRDAPFGQLVRLITKDRFFSYREERPGFQGDWDQVVSKLEEKAPTSSDTSDITPQIADVSHANAPSREDREVDLRLSTIPTARSSDGAASIATRTTTREQTRPWSRERFEVEQEEAAERQQSNIIIPQKTAEGVILVGWYTTDDPENPQNWSSRKKAFVASIIFAYTFAIYAASAIYISAIPQIMEKFGIGQTKASLGLAIYVLGYGLGPMVSQVHIFDRGRRDSTNSGPFIPRSSRHCRSWLLLAEICLTS